MPNTFFRFRQFTVYQDRTAMKVCTDSCLFGAWVADEISDQSIQRILDIGTGTGLLSLMLAQHTTAQIDAIEIEKDAFQQARENFSASPWAERITPVHAAIQNFYPTQLYDVIISNPPFYENDLKSAVEKRNAALHASQLSFVELLHSVKRLLKPNGRIFLLMPYEKVKSFESVLSQNELTVVKKILVKQSINHSCFRVMYRLKIGQAEKYDGHVEGVIAIKDASDTYTSEFRRLLKDYYL